VARVAERDEHCGLGPATGGAVDPLLAVVLPYDPHPHVERLRLVGDAAGVGSTLVVDERPMLVQDPLVLDVPDRVAALVVLHEPKRKHLSNICSRTGSLILWSRFNAPAGDPVR